VARAKDDTLFACIDGVVLFEDRGRKGRFISVLPVEAASVPATDGSSAEPAKAAAAPAAN
jgi:hypothetical protein